jgi:diacylglycerol kinase (ATP)
VPREIALLTNPTSGKGKEPGRGARRWSGCGCRLTVRDLSGRDADEAQDLARAAVADGVEALVVVGGDGMVHLGVQAVADTGTPLGIIPAGTGNDVARYFDLPRKDAVAAADRVVDGQTRVVDLARCGSKYFATVLAAGFDALVNERANRMTWPRGQMRYNLATLAELRVFKPLHYTLDLDGQQKTLDAMLVAVGNGPSFGGGLRITEGALLGRRPARRGGDQADEPRRPGADLPQAVQGHPRHAPAVRAPPRALGDGRESRGSRRTPTASASASSR